MIVIIPSSSDDSLVLMKCSMGSSVAGSLALAKPKLSGILMIISGIGGMIAISFGYIFGGPLLIVGGILALFGSRKESFIPRA